jgi:hypothetical protein
MRGEEGATERVGERETEEEEVGLADDAERRHRGGLVVAEHGRHSNRTT